MFESVAVSLNAYHCLTQAMAPVAVGDAEVCDKLVRLNLVSV